jgi:hypothetical protein
MPPRGGGVSASHRAGDAPSCCAFQERFYRRSKSFRAFNRKGSIEITTRTIYRYISSMPFSQCKCSYDFHFDLMTRAASLFS